MRLMISWLVSEDSGQDLAEYGLALGVIGAGAVVMALGVASGVNDVWTAANTAIQDAANLIAGS